MYAILIFAEKDLHIAQTLREFIELYAPRQLRVDVVVANKPEKVSEPFRIARMQEHLGQISGTYYQAPPANRYNLIISLSDLPKDFVSTFDHQIRMHLPKVSGLDQIDAIKKEAAWLIGTYIM